jgi:carbamoyl-phosphate synthase large subunit
VPAPEPGDDRPVRVLVTGAGGPAAVSFMRDVADPGVDLFAVDIDPCAAGLYLVRPDRRGLVPRGADPAFGDALLDRCRRDRIDVVVPTVDTEMMPVSSRRADFAEVGTLVLGPTVATLNHCLDKWDVMRTCASVGVVPRTGLLDYTFDPGAWDWPAIAKPRRGSGGRGVTLVAGPEELAHVPHDGSFIVQELLPGAEYSIDVLAYVDGRIAAVVPRTRLKVDSGIAVAGCTVHDQDLERIGRRVAEAIELTTVANVQVKTGADGVPRLLEVNPRFPGTMPLTVASGVDMPALALDDVLGRPVPDTVPFRPVAMVRHWREVFLEVCELEATGPLLGTAAG